MCLPEIGLKKIKYKLRKERKKREPDLGVGTHLLRDRGHITPKKKNRVFTELFKTILIYCIPYRLYHTLSVF